MIGTTINERYRLDEKLGEGGMAIVYRATDLETSQSVALKMLKTSLSSTARQRFAREFSAIASVDHPNCIKVFEFAETPSSPFFTMELFLGQPITSLIGDELPVLLLALHQAASAVEYVHNTGIIHRDLKPSNLLVRLDRESESDDQTVTLKLADFGLARFYSTPSSLSVDSGFVGTMAYSAPEQISNVPVNCSSDLYSLGVVCYELLSGRHPFAAAREKGIQSLIRTHLMEVPSPIRSIVEQIPADVEEIVLALLHKQPAHRPPSAAVLRNVLARHLGLESETNDDQRSDALDGHGNTASFVARHDELAEISRLMAGALSPPSMGVFFESPEPSVVFITGEAGIGKSHLLREVAKLARRHGADVFKGRCLEGNLAPFQPFVEALRQLLLQLGDLDLAQATAFDIGGQAKGDNGADAVKSLTVTHDRSAGRGNAEDVILNYAAELLRIAPELRGHLPGKAFRQVDLSRETNYVLRAIATFFVELATLHGTCLFIEDLHWADQSSLDLLRHIASILYRSREQSGDPNRRHPRLFVCCTSRPVPAANGFPRQMQLEHYVKRIGLSALSRPDAERLVGSVLQSPAGKISKRLFDAIDVRCKGNPYFITESVRWWQSSGRIDKSDGVWQLKDAADDSNEWPDSVRDVLHSRLESVSHSAGQILGTCSVIGPVIDVELLRQTLSEISETEFLDGVDELLQRRILFEAADPRYLEFSHDLLRELTYENLSGSRRLMVHRRVGEALEQRGIGPRLPEQLANHFYLARMAGRAFPYLIASGEAALSSYAIDDALRHLNHALEFEGDVTEPRSKLRLHELFATAYSAAGRPTEALASHQKRLELSIDAIETGRILQQIGEMHFRIGNFDEAIEVFDRSLQQVGYHRPRTTAGVIFSTMVSFARHALPRWLRIGLPRTRDRSERIKVAHSVFSTLELLWAQRNVLHCGQAHGRHLVLAGQIGDPFYLTHACARQALIFGIFSANWLALRAGRQALAFAKRAKNVEAEAIARGHVGCAHYFGGRLLEAEQLLRESVAVLDQADCAILGKIA